MTFAMATRRLAMLASAAIPSQPRDFRARSRSGRVRVLPVPDPVVQTRAVEAHARLVFSKDDRSAVATDVLIDSGSSGCVKNECSRNASIFCDRSTARTWSKGHTNGKENCDPGNRPKCGNHARSRPHRMGGAMTTLPSVAAY